VVTVVFSIGIPNTRKGKIQKMKLEAFQNNGDDRVSNKKSSHSSKNDLYKRAAREREQSQKRPIDASSKNGIQMDNWNSNALLKDTKDKVESMRDTSTATSAELADSKHPQSSRWTHLLKTVVIAALVATGSAQEVRANTTTSLSTGDGHGTR